MIDEDAIRFAIQTLCAKPEEFLVERIRRSRRRLDWEWQATIADGGMPETRHLLVFGVTTPAELFAACGALLQPVKAGGAWLERSYGQVTCKACDRLLEFIRAEVRASDPFQNPRRRRKARSQKG